MVVIRAFLRASRAMLRRQNKKLKFGHENVPTHKSHTKSLNDWDRAAHICSCLFGIYLRRWSEAIQRATLTSIVNCCRLAPNNAHTWISITLHNMKCFTLAPVYRIYRPLPSEFRKVRCTKSGYSKPAPKHCCYGWNGQTNRTNELRVVYGCVYLFGQSYILVCRHAVGYVKKKRANVWPSAKSDERFKRDTQRKTVHRAI